MEYRDYMGYRVYKDGLILDRDSNTEINKWLNPKGYWWSHFKGLTGWNTMAIHRFIVKAWGIDQPRYDIYMEVDHIDDDKTNNRIDNLQWLTKSENNQKTWDAGHKDNSGVKMVDVEQLKILLFTFVSSCNMGICQHK